MSLLDNFPVPWELKLSRQGFRITDAKGSTVIYTGTYSGDGDEEMNLSPEDAQDLVDLVNERAK